MGSGFRLIEDDQDADRLPKTHRTHTGSCLAQGRVAIRCWPGCHLTNKCYMDANPGGHCGAHVSATEDHE